MRKSHDNVNKSTTCGISRKREPWVRQPVRTAAGQRCRRPRPALIGAPQSLWRPPSSGAPRRKTAACASVEARGASSGKRSAEGVQGLALCCRRPGSGRTGMHGRTRTTRLHAETATSARQPIARAFFVGASTSAFLRPPSRARGSPDILGGGEEPACAGRAVNGPGKRGLPSALSEYNIRIN